MNTTPNENLEITNDVVVPSDNVNDDVNPLAEVPAEVAVATEETNETAVDTVEEICDETPTVESADSDNVESTNQPIKRNKKAFAFTGLLALLLVCVGLWVAYSGIFANKYSELYDTSNVSALYVKDREAKIHKPNNKTDVLMSSASDELLTGYTTTSLLEQTALRSPDGSAVFFYENYDPTTYSGDLYVAYNNGKKIAIDTGVSSGLMTSADGKIVMYAKVFENENASTQLSLYFYKKNGKPILIDDNYSPSINPMMSYSAKYIAYASIDAETASNALYVAKISSFGLKPVKVADNIASVYSVNDKGYVFFTRPSEEDSSKYELCYTAPKKEITMVAANASAREDCFGQLSNNFAYYLHTPENTAQFYVAKVGQEPQLLFEDSDYYLNPDVENKNYIFITIDKEDQSLLHIQRIKGKKAKTVAENISANGINNVLNSRDYNKITYVRNFDEATYSGEFFMNKTVLGMTKEVKIADNVSLAIGTPDLDYVAYFTELDLNTGKATLNLFDGKKSFEIAKDVPYYSVSFTNDGKRLFYLTDISEDLSTATLNYVKTSAPKKTRVVDTEISTVNTYEFLYASRTNGSLYYLKNYDVTTGLGDLYYAKKGKNPKLVETGISGLILE